MYCNKTITGGQDMASNIEVIVKKENRTTYIDIPFNASKKFNVKGKITVKGRVNDKYPYKKSLLSRGNGKYILTLNKDDLKRMNIVVGEKINMSIELDSKTDKNDIDKRNHEDVIRYYKSYKEKLEKNEIINVLEALFTRRSIRKFTGEVVSENDIETIIKAGSYAPTAENKQPWHYIVIREPKMLEKISECHPRAKMLPKAGCGIIVCGDKEIQSQVGFLIEDCSAAIENMMLAAHGLGLGSVWCGLYPAINFTKPIKRLFELPQNIIPVGMIAVGYVDEEKDIVYRYDKSKIHKEKW